MANKRHGKLGYFLVKIDSDDPLKDIEDKKMFETKFLINYSNKLDIGNVNMVLF